MKNFHIFIGKQANHSQKDKCQSTFTVSPLFCDLFRLMRAVTDEDAALSTRHILA